jgi:curved DNA-binding protein
MSLPFVEAMKGGEKRIGIARPRRDGSRLEEQITVRIPPGVTDGGRLRIPGKGGEGMNGGEAGDLWIQVHVEPHPVFRVEGRDLEFELPITVAEAVLGARVEVPTLEGRATLTIPPGTSSHSRLRLRGQGVPASKTAPAGDLYARIRIVVPRDAGAKLEEALRGLGEENPRKGLFP